VTERFAIDHRDPFARGQHRGIELATRPGRRVRAACAGRVTFAGTVPGSGRTLSERCGPYSVTYTRLATTSARDGESLRAGERIGTAGPRLHLGVRRADQPDGYLDPLLLLPTTSLPSPPPAAPAARRGPKEAPPPPTLPAVHGAPKRAPWRAAARPREAARGTREAVPAREAAPARKPAALWAGLGLLALAIPTLTLARGGRKRRTAAPAAPAPLPAPKSG
jgi:hypothetical protein